MKPGVSRAGRPSTFVYSVTVYLIQEHGLGEGSSIPITGEFRIPTFFKGLHHILGQFQDWRQNVTSVFHHVCLQNCDKCHGQALFGFSVFVCRL